MLRNFVFAELYTDRWTEADRRNQKIQEERFGTTALPWYAILGPDGRIRAQTGGGEIFKDSFIEFLNQGLSETSMR
ncbi:MAG: hypothetical protein HY716_00895 [Planctomycetes bacterium]|nr:hypothetical protein [Planctomycetota bacterium]